MRWNQRASVLRTDRRQHSSMRAESGKAHANWGLQGHVPLGGRLVAESRGAWPLHQFPAPALTNKLTNKLTAVRTHPGSLNPRNPSAGRALARGFIVRCHLIPVRRAREERHEEEAAFEILDARNLATGTRVY